MISVGVIYAYCLNGGIGYKNKIPWKCSKDIEHFWATIDKFPVIVGRKTWEGTKKFFLKHRPDALHIVLTKSKIKNEKNIVYTDNIEDALKVAESSGATGVWVCGGSSVYLHAETYAQVFVATQIFETYSCDAFNPWIWSEDHPVNTFEALHPVWLGHVNNEPDACVHFYMTGSALKTGGLEHFQNLGINSVKVS